MKNIFAIPVIVGIASAAAVPRADVFCASNGRSTVPEPPVDTLSGFNDYYGQLASDVPIPSGYRAVMTNTNCALASNKYMMYVKMESYDAQACADICSSHAGCDAFNIYVQRDPAVVPGPDCPNPVSIYTANCALYSEPVAESACTNFGQNIGPVDTNGEAFKVAIRASNVYSKLLTREVTKTVTTTKYMQVPVQVWTDGAKVTLVPRQKNVNENKEVKVYEKTVTGLTYYHVWNGQTLQIPSTWNRTVGWMDDNTEPYEPNVYVTVYSTLSGAVGPVVIETVHVAPSPSSTSTSTIYMVTEYVAVPPPAVRAVRTTVTGQAAPTPRVNAGTLR